MKHMYQFANNNVWKKINFIIGIKNVWNKISI